MLPLFCYTIVMTTIKESDSKKDKAKKAVVTNKRKRFKQIVSSKYVPRLRDHHQQEIEQAILNEDCAWAAQSLIKAYRGADQETASFNADPAVLRFKRKIGYHACRKIATKLCTASRRHGCAIIRGGLKDKNEAFVKDLLNQSDCSFRYKTGRLIVRHLTEASRSREDLVEWLSLNGVGRGMLAKAIEELVNQNDHDTLNTLLKQKPSTCQEATRLVFQESEEVRADYIDNPPDSQMHDLLLPHLVDVAAGTDPEREDSGAMALALSNTMEADCFPNILDRLMDKRPDLFEDHTIRHGPCADLYCNALIVLGDGEKADDLIDWMVDQGYNPNRKTKRRQKTGEGSKKLTLNHLARANHVETIQTLLDHPEIENPSIQHQCRLYENAITHESPDTLIEFNKRFREQIGGGRKSNQKEAMASLPDLFDPDHQSYLEDFWPELSSTHEKMVLFDAYSKAETIDALTQYLNQASKQERLIGIDAALRSGRIDCIDDIAQSQQDRTDALVQRIGNFYKYSQTRDVTPKRTMFARDLALYLEHFDVSDQGKTRAFEAIIESTDHFDADISVALTKIVKDLVHLGAFDPAVHGGDALRAAHDGGHSEIKQWLKKYDAPREALAAEGI